MPDSKRPQLTIIQGGLSPERPAETAVTPPFTPTPFTEFTLDDDGSPVMTPQDVQLFITAAEEHCQAGNADEVLTRLMAFPDPTFAAKIALKLAETYANPELAEAARQLLPEDEETHRLAGALTVAMSLNVLDTSETTQPAPALAAPRTDESAPAATLDEAFQRSIQQIAVTGSFRQSKRSLLSAADAAGCGGSVRAAYDEALIPHIEKLALDGQTNSALSYMKDLCTVEGRLRGDLAFDQAIEPLLIAATGAGQFQRGKELVKKTRTVNARMKLEQLFDARVDQHAAKLIEDGKPNAARDLLARRFRITLK